MDSAAAPYVAEIMDALAEKGVASVSRVIPDPHKDIGLNILSQFHYGPKIQIATFQTLADGLQSMAGGDFSPASGHAPRTLFCGGVVEGLPFCQRTDVV